jgi:replicative superfamily II helicase
LKLGVNLPAYAVIIKGTEVYNSDKGSFVDLSILDVFQIFGRAGRPQFEDRGVGFIFTSHDKLSHYLSAITQQHPIESSFAKKIANNLNAEISLGTITSITDAIKWLSYTYLFVRMKKNPFVYGLDWQTIIDDPNLGKRRSELLISAARKLHNAQMVVFDERTGYLTSKDLGRIASNFYIDYNTVEVINAMMRPDMTEADCLSLLCMSSEFENIIVRQEEVLELKKLMENYCVCAVKGGIETNYGKTNVLLQSYISCAFINQFALVADTNYIAKNSSRIMRALFEIAKSRNWGPSASTLLSLTKSIEKRQWAFQHALLQFDFPFEIKEKLENLTYLGVEEFREMDSKEIGTLIRNSRMGEIIKTRCLQFPVIKLCAKFSPITSSILFISLEIKAGTMFNLQRFYLE